MGNRIIQISRSAVLLSLVLNLLAKVFVAGFLFPGKTPFLFDHHYSSRQRHLSLRTKSLRLFHRSRTSGASLQERLRTRQWSSSSDDYSENQQSSDVRGHILTVSYENSMATVRVFRNETILAALERSPEVAIQLGLPGCALPSDCRRGNCLTCTAQHLPGSQLSNLQPATSFNSAPDTAATMHDGGDDGCVGDGLSPAMAKDVKEMRYVLTCSSTIAGDGVSLRLNVNDQAWQDLYRVRLEDKEETRQIARQAVARVMRRSAERNVVAWAQQTEEAFKKSGSSAADDF
jgi:hypothetical protein